MCEFKIIRKNDNSQIGEDVIFLGYTESNELIFKDIMGMGTKLESALILDVNTISQKTIVLEHPLIKDFIKLMKNLNENEVTKEEVENFQIRLDEIKNSL